MPQSKSRVGNNNSKWLLSTVFSDYKTHRTGVPRPHEPGKLYSDYKTPPHFPPKFGVGKVHLIVQKIWYLLSIWLCQTPQNYSYVVL